MHAVRIASAGQVFVVLVVLFGPGCTGGDRAAVAPPAARATPAAGLVAASVDDRGAPRFAWAVEPQPAAPGTGIADAALGHLRRHAAAYGASAGDVDRLELVRVHDRGADGAIAFFRQRRGGLEIEGGEIKVLVRGDRSLVAISGGLDARPVAGGLRGADKRAPLKLSMASAVARAIADRYRVAVAVRPAGGAALAAADGGGYHRFELAAAAPVRLGSPARVKPVLYPAGPALVPAYAVELVAGAADSEPTDARRYVIAAGDGAVLADRDLTQAESYQYRVWADASGDLRPADGPTADYTPHPTGRPDGSLPALVASRLITMEGFNHNPDGVADAWLPPGAEVTTGNNVDAYADIHDPDGYTDGDIRADVTAPGVFDHVYDFEAEPLATATQSKAAAVQAFYVANWLHDWYYDSGFDEAAGNAQTVNFGRGGAEGDAMKVEVQDGALAGLRDNAFMSTPADGAAPRMAIYVCTGSETRTLDVPGLGRALATLPAAFGPRSFAVTAPLVLGQDGAGTSTDLCEPVVDPDDVADKVVLVDRGTCGFKVKVHNAEAAGARAVIVANHTAGAGPMPLYDGAGDAVTVGALSVSREDGAALKAALAAGDVEVTIARHMDVEREGALDSVTAAHEWGHYLHHRLADCGAPQCSAMSEGWADFTAMHMVLRPGDNLDGTYGLATYSSVYALYYPDPGYFGMRRAPYTTDFFRNALTFRHIANGEALPTHPMVSWGLANSEAHSAGEIWANTMFGAYVALQRETASPTRSFDQIRRTMSNYVVAGLELTPTNATFTEQRDAVLAAVASASATDLEVMARAFARRGMGTCAVSPPRTSTDFVGVVEDFTVRPALEITGGELVEGAISCDGDGVLDPGETGQLRIDVVNRGARLHEETVLTVASTSPGVTFPAGTQVAVPAVAPFATTTVAIPVALAASAPDLAVVDVTIDAAASAPCPGNTTLTVRTRTAYDDVPAVSASDDVESANPAWARTGDAADTVWARIAQDPADHAWVGTDAETKTDTALTSPPLAVSATAPFVIRFQHRHEFETSPATDTDPIVYWDGGVIEISRDGGAHWEDVATYVDPGYGGVLSNAAENPLSDRHAFVDHNPSWPAADPVAIDLGTRFAGAMVQVRFRLGSDLATGAYGWELDDLQFEGIDNTPFPTLVPDRGLCGGGPDAGPDGGPGPVVDGGADAPGHGADDAGTGGGEPGGCGCRTGGGGAPGAALLVVAALLRRRRPRYFLRGRGRP